MTERWRWRERKAAHVTGAMWPSRVVSRASDWTRKAVLAQQSTNENPKREWLHRRRNRGGGGSGSYTASHNNIKP